MKNSKHIGLISQQHIITKLLETGYSVSIPLGDNNEYDLIVDTGSKLFCVQCKTGNYNIHKGTLAFNVASTASTGTRQRHLYTKKISHILVYNKHIGVLCIPYSNFVSKKASMVLRNTPAKNKQIKFTNNLQSFIFKELK